MAIPYRQMIFASLLMVGGVWVCEVVGFDLWLQDRLFDIHSQQWLLDRHNALLRTVFYDGPKRLLAFAALALLLVLIVTRRAQRWPRFRPAMWLLFWSMVLVPAVTTSLKNVTNVACPADLVRYEGDLPYVRVYESYPKGQYPSSRQRCFPAGHASGGFALLALFYLPLSKRRRYVLLAVGFAAGSIMGGYKMLIGHHFLSHTIATACLSWFLIHLMLAMGSAKWRNVILGIERPLERRRELHPLVQS
ncbi:phosphatase PAP2 family protein [Spongiibacter sp. KMU-158]|uniref:Phosphatase PAP2 family protein n=1 Tax=Spongiibacter pelagi TaxID=2760804 RepID=A0A927BYR3_9GAMM|nr:phosphatase PAP2 family protein [Spongiibacter pelagi]MBD2857499.1 phosphatase PAP2 family protein [Spongiibacter pelagi]